MKTLGDKIGAAGAAGAANIYYCGCCEYKSSRKYNYDRHIIRGKHKKVTLGDDEVTNPEQTEQKNIYKCNNCEKIYLSRNGMWKHNQICSIINKSTRLCNINKVQVDTNKVQVDTEQIVIDKEMMIMIIQQNKELLEIVKNGTNITNNNINSHNKTFNLSFFLNETCKDAMNIMDFVDSIKLQLSDLERIGEIGYVQGISDIITTNLRALDVTQRPVHCTDKKREIMYVKDQNEWSKEDDNKSKIRKMIKNIENKNIQVLPQFREKYPNYANPNSRESDKYNKTIIEAMGGIGDAETKENKIIRNISKVTTVREKE